VKLYDHPLSPYAIKVRLILYEKGIEFEKCEIKTRSDGEALRRLNPRAEVPALVDGEAVLFDSKVIAEYLEETHPEPALLPKDPAERARCRVLELRADTELDGAALAYLLFKFFRPALAEKQAEAFRASEASLRRHFAAFDRLLDGQPFLVGSFGRADIALLPHVAACAFLGLAPGEGNPHLAAWLERMNERESVQRATQEAMATVGKDPEDAFFDSNRLHWRNDRIEQLLRVGLGPWLLEELAADRAFLPPGP